jgi:hypothetical protein
MKNNILICLLSVCNVYGTDKLSKAIRTSDCAQTRSLLTEIKKFTHCDKTKYLDIAEKTYKLREKRLLLAEQLKSQGHLPPLHLPFEQLKKYIYGLSISTTGAVVSFYKLFQEKRSRLYKYLLPTSVLSGIALFYDMYRSNFAYMQTSYDHAVTVKELIYDVPVNSENGIIHYKYF